MQNSGGQDVHSLVDEVARLNVKIQQLEAQLAAQATAHPQGELIWDSIDNALFHLPIGIAILTAPDFRYFRINQYLADINQQPVAQHIGLPLAKVLPHVAPQLLPILREVLTTGKCTEHREFTMNTPNGEIRYLMDFHCPIGDKAVICMVLDITGQKTLEHALNNSNKTLDQNIKTLKETQHQLVQTAKLVSMGQLTAGLAHELNQPLGRILLTAELAQNKLHRQAAGQSAQTIDYLSRIIRDVKCATTLINHLKTYSRQDVKSVLVEIDLKTLITETLILFNHTIAVSDIDFQLQFNHHSPQLKGDPAQIEQVINNLIGNAIDALKEQEQEQEQKQKKKKGKKKGQLQITTYDSGKYTCIAVKDSGCGMPQSIIDNIFDPFFTTKQAGQGTGLGLSISLGIIKNHRGKLTVESHENKGSCFTIWLPNN